MEAINVFVKPLLIVFYQFHRFQWSLFQPFYILQNLLHQQPSLIIQNSNQNLSSHLENLSFYSNLLHCFNSLPLFFLHWASQFANGTALQSKSLNLERVTTLTKYSCFVSSLARHFHIKSKEDSSGAVTPSKLFSRLIRILMSFHYIWNYCEIDSV